VTAAIRICGQCRHIRSFVQIAPFRAELLGIPKVLEAKLKWDKEQRELATLEYQRFQAGADFDFEPHNYPWCEKWTALEGGQVIDPITGQATRLFVICARANARGDCPHWERL